LNILVTSDAKNLPHAYVMLVSLLDNTPNVAVNLFYLHNDISNEQIERFKAFFDGKLSRIEFTKLDTKDLEGLNHDERVPLVTYFRIRCAEVLPADVKRVLYLDPDIIIIRSIKEIYDTDLKGKYLGAVEDFFPYRDHQLYLNISTSYKYFNSGVMLIDIERFRENRVSERVFDFARRFGRELRVYDQDALNAILYDNWLPLDQKWNVTNICYEPRRYKRTRNPQVRKVPDDPAVIHYTCTPKPWDYLCDHPLKGEYWRYLAMTPFKGAKPSGITVMNIIRKARNRLPKILPAIVVKSIRFLKHRKY
jgi:UDP-glucose/galactose:(glucosyl)LPS alpha-1,2-glucosyl/galactosyltransferase